ncbi:MAG: hypothetical protein FWG63_09630 [Defluviitaleaceae bacterium]|nr:hypothetical protein [Defluviitaleaceae bacterium]
MFSFDGEHKILEHNVIIEDMEDKYHDKYMIAINRYGGDTRIRGDVVAILTPDEYFSLEKPKPMPSKYSVWKGLSLQMDGLGAYGYYL